jgi:hypothetical protein
MELAWFSSGIESAAVDITPANAVARIIRFITVPLLPIRQSGNYTASRTNNKPQLFRAILNARV